MAEIKKYKTFKEAGQEAFQEFYKRPFDPVRIKSFFDQFSGISKNPYKPGIYRFKSFKDARKYDMELYIKVSFKK